MAERDSVAERDPIVVIGAGPAGLAAAHELGIAGACPVVLEKSGQVGGLSRTQEYKGFLFDVGGHRFYTRSCEVRALWEDLCGDDLLTVRRMSRIYYGGRFFSYPLKPRETLARLGMRESTRVISGYLAVRARRRLPARNLEQWTVNRFGRRLYEIFFKTYSEKVWGIPCTSIDADWADLRIGDLSMGKALRSALLGRRQIKTLIDRFQYPRLGPGLAWTRLQKRIEAAGGQVRLGCEVVGLERDGMRVTSVVCRTSEGLESLPCSRIITSMPLADLILGLHPAPPERVVAAARDLRYRAFIMVGLILDRDDLFPDNWIYVHAPEVRVGRIQNFRNWSAELVPVRGKSSVGMEYFCDEGDEFWNRSDEELIALARRELARLGLASEQDVSDATVVREMAAYPLYLHGYQREVGIIRAFVDGFENLQTIGRNGMHRYNNQDHSMLAGMMSARNLMGEAHDLWSVDPDALQEGEARMASRAGTRVVPGRTTPIRPEETAQREEETISM